MSFFDKLFGRKTSAETAKQRLRFVLVHDRAEIPPGVLALIKDDIIAVISRRVNIDRDHVEVNVTHEDTESKLLVDIPLIPSVTNNQAGRVSGTPARRKTGTGN